MHSIYLDLQKAFDKVPHDELLLKLNKKFGLEDLVINWLKSFLKGRRQRVRVGKTLSSWKEVQSGVPQGSVLAPLLFILYVSDMQETLKDVNVLKFADDTKIYMAVTKQEDIDLIQSNLNKLSDWFLTWKMPINIKKSGIIHFGSQNSSQQYELYCSKLELFQRERDLGVIMDNKLSYKHHIQLTVSKAWKLYGWMVRNVESRDKLVILHVYKTMLRPLLEYASTVWSPHRIIDLTKIERIQKSN